jgi:hypothetical protein
MPRVLEDRSDKANGMGPVRGSMRLRNWRPVCSHTRDIQSRAKGLGTQKSDQERGVRKAALWCHHNPGTRCSPFWLSRLEANPCRQVIAKSTVALVRDAMQTK